MGRARVVWTGCAVAIALATLAARAQSPDAQRFAVELNLGLPAVDEGPLNVDLTHAPQTPEALKRSAMHDVLHATAAGASGVPYQRGRLLVKFRDSASDSARQAAVAAASGSAAMAARPSYADFDVVTL